MPPRSTPRKRARSSSDPLAAPVESSAVASPPPEASSSRRVTRAGLPKTQVTPTPRESKAVALVGFKSAQTKAIVSDAGEEAEEEEVLELAGQIRADTPSSSRHDGPAVKRPKTAPATSRKGKEKAIKVEMEVPPSTASPRRARPPTSTSTPTPLRSTRKTLGSALKPLPTPPPSHRTTSSAKMRHFDEAFEDPFEPVQAGGTGAISREVFLANEALRRQREARNFRYEGDVDAPTLTRSGRVIGHKGKQRAGRVSDEEDEVGDAYGDLHRQEGDEEDVGMVGVEGTETEDIQDPDERTIHIDPIQGPDGTAEPAFPDQEIMDAPAPLPPGARAHILRILSTLTGHNIATAPPPFADEETNEALVGFVNLLKGTVERGEGNSALLVGPRGSGKTRTIARAIQLLPSTSTTQPIIVRLSGHAQTNDRLAIREMGRQISEAEGKKIDVEGEEEGEEEEHDNEEYAPTTLPSHLLALLTAPSPRAIVIIMEEFDLFTEHARQALLYCLLDVVQSIKTGPVETTGRGVAVIGLTSRIDTLLLLEKRVKSRFSHRVWRTVSPISPGSMGWKPLLQSVLLPPAIEPSLSSVDQGQPAITPSKLVTTPSKGKGKSQRNGKKGIVIPESALERWLLDWKYGIDFLLDDGDVAKSLDRLTGLTTDVRNLYRPFIIPISQIAASQTDILPLPTLLSSISAQISLAGWSTTASGSTSKLKSLPQPELAILVISKHLSYAGREEFNFRQVEEEYLRFARTRLVGSGRVRWPVTVLRGAFDNLLHLGLLVSTGSSSLNAQFAKVRCTLSPHEIVAWFKGDGANTLSTELSNWGRMLGGHA